MAKIDEAQQAELEYDPDDAWAGLKIFWRKHGNKVLVVVLACLLGVLLYRFWERKQEQAKEEAWSSLENSTDPGGYAAAAEAHSDMPAIRAAAYLRGGDVLRDSVLKSDVSDNPLTPEEKTHKLKEALDRYQSVLEMSDANELFKLNARLGIAAVDQSLAAIAKEDAAAKLWADAADQYKAVIDQAKDRYPALSAQAAALTKELARVKKPVVLAAEQPMFPNDLFSAATRATSRPAGGSVMTRPANSGAPRVTPSTQPAALTSTRPAP